MAVENRFRWGPICLSNLIKYPSRICVNSILDRFAHYLIFVKLFRFLARGRRNTQGVNLLLTDGRILVGTSRRCRVVCSKLDHATDTLPFSSGRRSAGLRLKGSMRGPVGPIPGAVSAAGTKYCIGLYSRVPFTSCSISSTSLFNVRSCGRSCIGPEESIPLAVVSCKN